MCVWMKYRQVAHSFAQMIFCQMVVRNHPTRVDSDWTTVKPLSYTVSKFWSYKHKTKKREVQRFLLDFQLQKLWCGFIFTRQDISIKRDGCTLNNQSHVVDKWLQKVHIQKFFFLSNLISLSLSLSLSSYIKGAHEKRGQEVGEHLPQLYELRLKALSVSENMSFSFCFVWVYMLANTIKGDSGYMIAHIQLFLFPWYNSLSDSSTSLQIQS